MIFAGRTAIVTGAGQGIGRAICHALAAEGMRIVVSDLNADLAQKVATEIGGLSVTCDVSDPGQIERLIGQARAAFGRIDLFCSNAGFAAGEPDGAMSASDDQWQASWDVHVMAHVRACRLVLPEMIARGEGCLVNIASAAGLLSQIGDAAYSASKHAAVSVAQSLAITHGDQGIQVSVVCPLYVATPLLGYDDDSPEGMPNSRVLRPQEVARALVEGLQQGRFLILPHPEAQTFAQRRATDMDRWIAGMRALRRTALKEGAEASLRDLHRLI
ncbi:SDR family oxidoreductase [Puniceibacterium confluentis]|uniref:SDR family oxidoreductase n=2 Tax=Puniceibacterium confluentis TaxID=1958944 RepID=UPI0011B80C9E|nr:SDR family oxidoreductase [Puniceibacterium confluentis]